MSITTRPPGDAARPEPSRPAAPGPALPTPTVTASPSPSATGPGTPVRTPMPDGAGALRVFVEEVRAAVQAQLSGATRPEALPPLPDADPGNAVAALLRWLRAATAGAPVAPATLKAIVEEAHARAAEQVQRAAASASAPESGAASTRASPASADPLRPSTAPVAPRTGGANVPAGATGATTPAPVRETLAAARELVLRALVADDPRATAAAAGERPAPQARDPRASGAPPASPRDAGPAGARTSVPSTTAPRANAVPASGPAGLSTQAPSTPIAGPSAGTSVSSVAPLASRVPPVDAPALLRTFVDGIRDELGRTVGATRLPSSPLPLVTDTHGAQLGPALLRWLTSAVAEKGVPLAPLQDAVRTSHARAATLLPPLEPTAAGAAQPAVLQARDALLAVRDHVLRGLGVPADRLDVGVARDVATSRADVRADLPVADPRGVPVSSGALVRRGDRVEEIGAGRRSRAEEGADGVADDEPAADARAGAEDLQGPMDCIRRYFDAYLAGDSAGYAAQWVYPACVWSGGRWSSYANAAACARGNDEYTLAARAQGIVGGRIVMLRVEPTTDDVAVVHGVFTRERADGTVVAETETAYTTVRTEAGWRVAVCVVKK